MAVPATTARPLGGATLRDRGLWAGCAIYAVVYFAFGWIRYSAHRNFVDLGIFAQTAASAFGCFCNPIEGSHWQFHFSPILYLAGAVMQLWHSPLALVAIAAVSGALAAPPVYGLVLRRSDRKCARLAAAVILLYPPLAGAIFNDFHEDALAPAAIAWLAWAFDGGLPIATVVFALLAIAIKEDQALFVALAGVFAAAAYRKDALRLRLAVAVSACGAAAFVLYFAVIQPHAAGAAHWMPARFYAWTAADWRDLFPTGIGQRLFYLVLAFLPLLFIPFRVPAIATAVPGLIEVLGSRLSTTYTIGSHYAGAWLGYAFYAFAVGLGMIGKDDRHRAHRALYWCLALCVAEFATADPLHPGNLLHAPSAKDVRLDAFLRSLPRTIDVATQEEAYTHLAATDPRATLLPETNSSPIRSCYVLVDWDFADSPRLVESADHVRALIARGELLPVRTDGAIRLYRSPRCP